MVFTIFCSKIEIGYRPVFEAFRTFTDSGSLQDSSSTESNEKSRAPWWKGMCEHMVRTTMDNLRRTLYKSDLNWEKLRTAISGVEFSVNSRLLDVGENVNRHRRTDNYHATDSCERTTYFWPNRIICQFFGTCLPYMLRYHSQRKTWSVTNRKMVRSLQVRVHARFGPVSMPRSARKKNIWTSY